MYLSGMKGFRRRSKVDGEKTPAGAHRRESSVEVESQELGCRVSRDRPQQRLFNPEMGGGADTHLTCCFELVNLYYEQDLGEQADL